MTWLTGRIFPRGRTVKASCRSERSRQRASTARTGNSATSSPYLDRPLRDLVDVVALRQLTRENRKTLALASLRLAKSAIEEGDYTGAGPFIDDALLQLRLARAGR